MSSILVVDDNDDICRALSRLLRNLGHDTECAADGDAAIGFLRRQPFDLIILDIMMPAMDGLEVLARIKADPTTAPVPVVMYSAIQDPQVERVARARGAVDFWLKATFDFSQLADRVADHLGPRGSAPARA